MNREQAESLLAQLLADELDEPTRAELNAYLETDSSLREQLADMRLTAQLLRDAANAEGEPRLSAKRMAKLEKLADGGPRSWRLDREVVFSFRTWGSIAAALLLMVGLAGIMMPAVFRTHSWRADEVADASDGRIAQFITIDGEDEVAGEAKTEKRWAQDENAWGYVADDGKGPMAPPAKGRALADRETTNRDFYFGDFDGHEREASTIAGSGWKEAPSFDLSEVAADTPAHRAGLFSDEGGAGSSGQGQVAQNYRRGSTKYDGTDQSGRVSDIDDLLGDLPTLGTSPDGQTPAPEDRPPVATKLPGPGGGRNINGVGLGDGIWEGEVHALRGLQRTDRDGDGRFDQITTGKTDLSAGNITALTDPSGNVAFSNSGKLGRDGADDDWAVAIDAKTKSEWYDKDADAPRLTVDGGQKTFISDLESLVETNGTAPTSGTYTVGGAVSGPAPAPAPEPTARPEAPVAPTTIAPDEPGNTLDYAYKSTNQRSSESSGAAGYESDAAQPDITAPVEVATKPTGESNDAFGVDLGIRDRREAGEAPERSKEEVAQAERKLDSLDKVLFEDNIATTGTGLPVPDPARQSGAETPGRGGGAEQSIDLYKKQLKEADEVLTAGDKAKVSEALRHDQNLRDARRGEVEEGRERELKREAHKLNAPGTDTAKVPVTEVLVYPADWPELTRRRLVENEKNTVDSLRVEAAQQDAEPKPADITELPTASTFRSFPVNPWVLTEKDHQSTFALDTDSASYTLCRNYIRAGYRPPAGAVRMEEFINAFDYHYPTADDQTFTVHAEAAPAPFAAAGRHTVLLKVGVKGKVIGRDGRKPMHLIFVVDASGSMAREDRLPLVRYALGQLSMQLQEGDRVSLITYGTDAKLHLEAAPVDNPKKVINAINNIQPGGSTNLLQGIEKAYQIAGRHFKSGQVNRVILCSDGVANIGETDAQQMLARVDAYRKQGITFTAAGFGMGGLNDALLEELANKGDGNYLFVDTKAEAYRAFVTDMTATLQTIAKDAKIQVEFNPARVRRYRLVGYENRDIADKDFRNDSIDAGEVGSGQSATALYELELTGPIRSDERLPQLGTVYVRYKDVDTHAVEEISRLLSSNLVELRTPKSNPRFYLAASAGAFAELLRQSPHARDVNPTQVLRVLEEVAVALPLDKQVTELRDLVRASIDLPPAP